MTENRKPDPRDLAAENGALRLGLDVANGINADLREELARLRTENAALRAFASRVDATAAEALRDLEDVP